MTQTKEEHYEYAIQIHTTSLWIPSRVNVQKNCWLKQRK